ncbi:hypothetical protein [Pseudomonas syringae group genomosp. 3]|uniref:hypothetical protein n=1 Tax=Pseudomonas syringae group genomosp. 3 TaxID=251701 RepID=UPI0005C8E315|nr:hypothetical protein [Pseudomonas syringae group genomosp. 3]
MKICKWAFVIEGPRASLECLPANAPWWSLSLLGDHSEWEAWIPTEQSEDDFERQFDAAMQAVVKMNGVAVSNGHHGLIKMTHHVAYDPQGNRIKTIPLRLALTVTKLSGFGPTPPASIDFSRIDSTKLSILGTLWDYWGQPNAESYEGLYKIFELIQSADPEIPKVISTKKRSRLKQTCNCMSSGPTARHADMQEKPVVHPMPLGEIRTIVGNLSDLYIESITRPRALANILLNNQPA